MGAAPRAAAASHAASGAAWGGQSWPGVPSGGRFKAAKAGEKPASSRSCPTRVPLLFQIRGLAVGPDPAQKVGEDWPTIHSLSRQPTENESAITDFRLGIAMSLPWHARRRSAKEFNRKVTSRSALGVSVRSSPAAPRSRFCYPRARSNPVAAGSFDTRGGDGPSPFRMRQSRLRQVAYSAFACCSTGMSGSASFQRAKKSW